MHHDVEFDAGLGSVREARDALGDFCSFLSEERVQTARLLVSELVTNSIRHSGIFPSETIYLTLAGCEQGLLVEVRDPGEGFEPSAAPTAGPNTELQAREGDASGGFGLSLLERLSDGWGTTHYPASGEHESGLFGVWFELDGGISGL